VTSGKSKVGVGEIVGVAEMVGVGEVVAVGELVEVREGVSVGLGVLVGFGRGREGALATGVEEGLWFANSSAGVHAGNPSVRRRKIARLNSLRWRL
jgi:hypothetical protein